MLDLILVPIAGESPDKQLGSRILYHSPANVQPGGIDGRVRSRGAQNQGSCGVIVARPSNL